MKNIKKYLGLLLLLICFLQSSYACEVCEKQQPKILRGITHGGGPQGNFDYIAIWIMIVITLGTLYYSIKWLIKPGEKGSSHIKRTILNDF